MPKLSTPLKAGIRTSEGILAGVITGLISICSVVDPHALPKKESAWLVAAIGVLYGAQRGLLKIVALQKGFGVGAPIDDQKLDHTMAAITDQAAAVQDLIEKHSAEATKFEQLVENISAGKVTWNASAVAKEVAGLMSGPATVVDPDPASTAAQSLNPDEEAAVQPPAPAESPDEPTLGTPPAVPSAAATIPPPGVPADPAGGPATIDPANP